jgi:8-amino-7-oxononanoate synthase
LEEFILAQLRKRQSDNSFRELRKSSNLIDFFSNDYLGLARSEDLHQRIQNKLTSLPHLNGSTGSRLLSGNFEYTEYVEKKLSGIFEGDSALIFNSGYAANLGVLSSIPQKDDTILYDEKCHASIKDGARLSLSSRHPFKHNDLSDLAKKMKRSKGNTYVVVESIYSMDGDECPLNDLVALCELNGCTIILDEAHSTGTHGKRGSGLATSLKLHQRIPIRIYTFGKGMGVHGACVVGSELLKQYLVNFSRPFIYTTAPDFHTLASIECAFDFLGTNIHVQSKLESLIQHFRIEAQRLSNYAATSSSIQTLSTPGNEYAKSIANHLQKNGFDVRPILSPTVPRGQERLRICLHTFNTESDIRDLVNSIESFPQR